ncbi:MAG: hypothetical protein ACO24D_16730 [bacterium]
MTLCLVLTMMSEVAETGKHPRVDSCRLLGEICPKPPNQNRAAATFQQETTDGKMQALPALPTTAGH